MNKTLLTISLILLMASCKPTIDKEKVKEEVFNAEKAFEKMVADKGVAEAFSFFAAQEAVIKRGEDILIKGPENIKNFYLKTDSMKPEVYWTPDFIEVSDCGNMAYTYGKYVWKIKGPDGQVNESTGIFHTVWKRQKDGNWKYVWD